VNPQKDTFSSIFSGNARAPAEASLRCAVPMDEVGQATSDMNARSRSSSSAGCARTKECPSPGAKTEGATRRQVSQSMQEEST